ncbi:FtsX-like permease family protein [Sporosarcina sp. FSL K6-3457]|uniref:FtsX-like permease family protein n=1 Tax=Sporosarcina sp. FSL K6-3457 TaxID=2978204 RepID=UPI0030FC68FB
MKSLNRIALRLFQTHPFIVFTSVASIAIAVSLVITLAVFSTNAKQTLQEEMKALYGEFDVAVVYDDNQPIQNEQLLYELAANHPGTDAITEVLVTQAFVEKLVGEVYTVGIENDPLAQSRYKTTAKLEDNSVIMTAALAEALQVTVGDPIVIENRTFSIIEIITNAKGTAMAPDILIFVLDTAKSFKNHGNHFSKFETTALMIKAKKDVDVLAMAVDLKEFHGNLRVDVMEQEEFVEQNMNSLALFIVVMSVLVLLVTSLMVLSNFELFMYKNRNQLAIMRAMGAKTKQIAKIVWVQSALINILGTTCGLFLAMLAHQFVQPLLERLLSFEHKVATFNVGVALIVVVMSAIIVQLFLSIPVYKSTKMLPLMMMQANEKIDFGHRAGHRKIGKLLLFVAICILLLGMYGVNEDVQALPILLGALLLLASLFTLFPVYIVPVIRFILPFIKRVCGTEAYIAVQNFIPQVRQNTFVMLSISVLMMITVVGSVLMTTIQHNNVKYIDSQFSTSIVVKSRIYESEIDGVRLSEEIRAALPAVEVSAVSHLYGTELLFRGQPIVYDYVLANVKGLERMGLVPTIREFTEQTVIISPQFAKDHRVAIGDTFDIGMYLFDKQRMDYTATIVVGQIADTTFQADVVFDWQVQGLYPEFIPFDRLYVQAENEETTISVLEQYKSQYPALQIHTHAKASEEAKEMFVQRWSIFIVVLLALVLAVMVGVGNTLMNTLYSKRKEFAVLRTIGVRPWGIVQIMVTQVVLYVLIGLLFGGVCGLLLSFVISLIDMGGYAVNGWLILSVGLSMLVSSILIVVPMGRKIGRQNISVEMKQDNK